MKQLHWTLVRAAEWLGGAGMAALLLAVALAAYLPLGLWPVQQRLAALEQAPRAVPRAVAAQPPLPPARAFLASFPSSDALAGELQQLFDIAAQYQLDLGEVSYKWERRRSERLQRYQVSFTLDAPYPDARAFLADVLAALPHAALDQLSFNRDSVQTDSVQTSVRLTLYLVR